MPDPGIQTTLAAGIAGRLDDPDRFANLARVRAFTGLVASVHQSGNAETRRSPTKVGNTGLRRAFYLAAERVRRVDGTLAANHRRLVVDRGKHHTYAICHLAAQFVTRLAACWRNGNHYFIRDTNGRVTSEDADRSADATGRCDPRPPTQHTTRRAK